MGSQQNDSTSFPLSEQKLCANRCGFFGSASNMNLCSKCYRDLLVKGEQAASAKATMEKSFNPRLKQEINVEALSLVPITAVESSVVSSASSSTVVLGGDQCEPKVANRCFSCKKKVGLTGFKCKCGYTYCGIHRYPERHQCLFDFKGTGRDAIAKANPVVKADKVERI